MPDPLSFRGHTRVHFHQLRDQWTHFASHDGPLDLALRPVLAALQTDLDAGTLTTPAQLYARMTQLLTDAAATTASPSLQTLLRQLADDRPEAR